MAQIHGGGDQNYSNTAEVTSAGELLTTGSQFKSTEFQVSDILIGRDSQQILSGILKEMKKMNIHMEKMTELEIKNEDVENS